MTSESGHESSASGPGTEPERPRARDGRCDDSRRARPGVGAVGNSTKRPHKVAPLGLEPSAAAALSHHDGSDVSTGTAPNDATIASDVHSYTMAHIKT